MSATAVPPRATTWRGQRLVEGERYRVTFELVYTEAVATSHYGNILRFAEGEERAGISDGCIVALEVLPEPLAVGDMVQLLDDETCQPFYEVLKAASDYVVIWRERYGEAKVVRPHELRRAE